MTKRLYLLRHGQAESGLASADDHQRCLTSKGQAQCRSLAQFMKQQHLYPELVCISSAQRTRETSAILKQCERFDHATMEYYDPLYLASAGELLQFVNQLPDAHQQVMMIGHNPGLQEIASLLLHDADHDAVIAGVPPCTMIALELPHDAWSDVVPAEGRLHSIFRPNK